MTPGSKAGFNRSLANLLVVRGDGAAAVSGADAFADPALYAAWGPPRPFTTWRSRMALGGHPKSATLLSNSQSVVGPLERITAKAWETFASRAFVHQYTAHGVSEDAFVDNFVKMEQLIASYKELGAAS